MKRHTNKQPATTQEKKRKAAGECTLCCDAVTVLTRSVMASTIVPDELRQMAQERKPWIIVLTAESWLMQSKTECSFTNTYQNKQCWTAASRAMTAVVELDLEEWQAVHTYLTSQNLVELIATTTTILQPRHTWSCTLRIRPPGSDCETMRGVYLPSNDLQKREELYQVITDCMSSEDKRASHAGLPMPYNIMAGGMNAALQMWLQHVCTRFAEHFNVPSSTLQKAKITQYSSWKT